MPQNEYICPACKTKIPEDAVLAWRPFSCPNCHAIVDPVFRGGWSQAGCLSILVLIVATLIFAGMRWYWGLLVGLAIAVAIGAIRVKVSRRIWPRPRAVRRHILRTYPSDLLPLADFIESIATADEWTPAFDNELQLLGKQRSLDDWLENAAVEFAWNFKDPLQGATPHKKKEWELDRTLEQRREQLRAVARDLRFAAKS